MVGVLQRARGMKARRNRKWRRGAVLAEYAVALLVAIPAVAGMAAGGYQMLENYRGMKAAIKQPGP